MILVRSADVWDIASTMFPPVVKTPDYREPEISGILKAPFTRDQTNVYPDENWSLLLRLHSSAKKFVHLTFPFTWVLPESIRKAAFRIPTAEIVVHRSNDSNIKTIFLFHGFIFIYRA